MFTERFSSFMQFAEVEASCMLQHQISKFNMSERKTNHAIMPILGKGGECHMSTKNTFGLVLLFTKDTSLLLR